MLTLSIKTLSIKTLSITAKAFGMTKLNRMPLSITTFTTLTTFSLILEKCSVNYHNEAIMLRVVRRNVVAPKNQNNLAYHGFLTQYLNSQVHREHLTNRKAKYN